MERFTFFWSGPFSQWYPATFKVEGVTFNCAEQYMMYMKAWLFNDIDSIFKIMESNNPKEQKRLGRLVEGFQPELWNKLAKKFVYFGNYCKFAQNIDLKEILLSTQGTTLVEASPHDIVWGIGLAEHDSRAFCRDTWLGTNWLGEVLTSLRDDLILKYGDK